MSEKFIEVDKNFEVKSTIEKDGLKFYDVEEAPFKVYGVFKADGVYRRMPESVARTVSEGVYNLHTNTSGGRIRFKTNSRKISIIVKLRNVGLRPHFALSGIAGLDVYDKASGEYRYAGTFIPPVGVEDGFESSVDTKQNTLRDITVNMPLYNDVLSLHIGVDEDAVIEEADDYKIELPIVYYGSSITQGGCASRPGRCYQNIISRKFDCDYINLGFSGNAKAEDEMADYIKDLKMSAFVYDYDHNAPTCHHLEETHERMFKVIREAQPELPIIILSRPKYYLDNNEQKRLEVIKTTYTNALANGDKNVYMLDGKQLMFLAKGEGTVDGGHPTDFGFLSMAEALSEILNEIF